MFTLLPGLYIFNKPFYINPFTADSRWDLPKYFLDLPNAAHSAVPTQTTTRCTLGFGHPAAFFDSISSLWTHLFFFLMNPRTMMMPVARITRLTSSLCDGPRATEGSYLAAARAALETGDTLARADWWLVTRCKLWSQTSLVTHSLLTELWWCETLQRVDTAYWIRDIRSIYVIKP